MVYTNDGMSSTWRNMVKERMINIFNSVQKNKYLKIPSGNFSLLYVTSPPDHE